MIDDERRRSAGRRAIDQVLQMTPRPVSIETAVALQALWKDAVEGKIIGLAYVAFRTPLDYEVHIVGDSVRHDIAIGAMLTKARTS